MQIIVSLQIQLNQLISGGSPVSGGGMANSTLKSGDTVKTTANVNVRLTPGFSGSLIRVIPAGSVGEIVTSQGENYRNPTIVGGYTWYRVRYESLGITGWSAGNWLAKQSSFAVEPSVPSATISSVTNSENPTVRGFAYNTNTVGFSVDQGDKVYGSGEIAVVNNVWSHKISTDLENGEYNLTLTVRNKVVARTSFMVQNPSISFARVSMTVDEYNDSSDTMVAELDFGNRTAYSYEIDWGEGDRTVQTVRSRIVTVCNSVWTCSAPSGQLHTYAKSGSYTVKLYALVPTTGGIKRTLVTTDSITINIANEAPQTATFEGFMDGRKFITTHNISNAAALENCLLNAQNNPAREIRCVWNKQEIYRTTGTQASQSASSQELRAMVTELINQVNSYGKNASVPSRSSVRTMSDPELQAQIARLMALIAVEQNTSPANNNSIEGFWDIDENDGVYVVGVYEGSYPSGVSHSGNYHPQGEVILNMTKQAGQSLDTMLILTAYEPVLWKLQGDATQYVTRVFLSGYHEQEITGIGPNVEVINLSHEGGDSEYFYAYDRNSNEFKKLQTYLKHKTGKTLDLYHPGSGHSANRINLGQKG